MPDLSLVSSRVPSRVTVLSGGVGGARFIRGLLHLIQTTGSETAVSVVTNTADDWWIHGLKVCPDLDTVMYTLGEGIDQERGWGRVEESWQCKEELAAYGVEPTWFGLGDRDLATHLVRTQMLDAGYSLTDVTAALCTRWNPGVTLLPMTDDRVETHVVITDPADGEQKAVHFQEYWVRHRANVPAHGLAVIGLAESRATNQVVEAITGADLVIVPPSNPIVSVGTIVGVPGVREALESTAAPVVGVSGIVGGDHVHGMARQLLTLHDIEVSAAGVAEHYGARPHGLLDAWLVDERDAGLVSRIESAGIKCQGRPLMMTDLDATAAIARAAIELVS